MKRLLVLFVLAIAAVGCDGPTKSVPAAERALPRYDTPEKAASAYLDAVYTFRMTDAYDTLSAADRQGTTLGDFQRKMGTMHDAFANVKRSYGLGEVRRDGDSARVYATVEQPDLAAIEKQVLEEFTKQGSVPTRAQLELQKRALVEGESPPMTTVTEEIVLVEEEDGWRVSLGWGDTPGPTPVPE